MNHVATSSPQPQIATRTQIVVAGLTLFALWFVLCRHLSSEWSLNEQYSYGWFVPFFAAFLFWLRWDDRPEAERRNAERGRRNGLAIGIAVLALVILLPVRLFEVANPDWRPLGWVHAFAVIAITFVIVFFIGGWSWVKHFRFPILFFLVAVPWISPLEAPVVQGLMKTIATLATETVSLLGIPAQVQGNLIRIATGVVGINEACSGVRSLQTSLMIGLLFGELKRLRPGPRSVLVAGAVAIALVANFFRAVFLVWIASTRGIAAVDRWHDFAGYAIVALVFVGSLGLAAALGKGGMRNAECGIEKNFPFRIPHSAFLISLSWLLAVEIAVEGWYRAHERDLIPRVAWDVRAPANANGLHEIKIEEGVRQTLRFDSGKELVWKSADENSPGNPTINYLFWFRWNPGSSSVVRARAHRPDICLPDAGWKQLADYGTKMFVAKDGIELLARHVSFRQENGSATVHTFFCLQEDKVHREEARPDLQLAQGVQPDWSLRARARVVRHGIRNLGQQVLEVVFLTPHPVETRAAEEQFAALVQQVVERK